MSSFPQIASATDLAGLSAEDWFETLEDVVDQYGSYNFLGKGHAATQISVGPKLLVTFESAESVIARDRAANPVGFRHVQEDGWSHLGIFAEHDGWFRHPKIYAYFDRLIDDGYFEDFDEILFYGTDGGGYAAAAYSVAAPGARVLAIRPQATLDPQITGFDQRYRTHRRLDFHSRYGYAPTMIDAAAQAYIAFDPLQRLDAIHAALFTKPHVQSLRCTALGPRLERALDDLGVSVALRRLAMTGDLTPLAFARAQRARRTNVNYLRRMLRWTETAGKPRLAATVCKHALALGHTNVFAETLDALHASGHFAFGANEIRAAE